jgi:hypothetical protein
LAVVNVNIHLGRISSAKCEGYGGGANGLSLHFYPR